MKFTRGMSKKRLTGKKYLKYFFTSHISLIAFWTIQVANCLINSLGDACSNLFKCSIGTPKSNPITSRKFVTSLPATDAQSRIFDKCELACLEGGYINCYISNRLSLLCL